MKMVQQVRYLRSWFKIDKPGIYTMIIMHPIASGTIIGGPSWEDGFLISNAVKINLIEK
jgi:hypothetical protein